MPLRPRGVSSSTESSSKEGCKPFLWQLDSVSLDPRKPELEMVALRPNGLDLHRLAGRLRGRHYGLGGEVEGNAEDIGIFGVEQPSLVQVVRLAAQGPC